MTHREDPKLKRYWFCVRNALGIGVTAFTRAEATHLAQAVATEMHWTLHASEVIENVDVRSLDQQHIIPNMKPPNLRGVWFPAIELR